jgi:hypothetical protein
MNQREGTQRYTTTRDLTLVAGQQLETLGPAQLPQMTGEPMFLGAHDDSLHGPRLSLDAIGRKRQCFQAPTKGTKVPAWPADPQSFGRGCSLTAVGE